MISAVILTKNEEKVIGDCIKSLTWCDEILVIDDSSTDNTTTIAKKLEAQVLHHPMKNFAAQRNHALQQAKGEWVLFVDADEIVPEALRKEIQKILANNTNVNGYLMKRQDILWGKALKHGETGQIQLLRLGRKNVGTWQGYVHETWHIKGKTAELSNPLMHYPHQSISEFLSKINRYSDIRAQELFEQGERTSAFLIIVYPKAKFAYNYFVRLGFLDGIPGIIHALMMSMHSFLVRGKLWLLWQKKFTS